MVETNIQIRRAHKNDANYLAKLNDEFNGVGITEEEVILSLSHSNEIVVIAVMNDVPVGFVCAQYYQSICYSDPSAEITELYVTSHARRKGIASKLLNYIENELLINGVKSVKVLTGKKKGIAIKTYENSNYITKDEQVLQKKF